jgi:hypothetical protein
VNYFSTDGEGNLITRPPFISGCDIPFSDVEWFANRVWGIGDPEFPQRLYYSEFDRTYDWPVTNNLSLDEDDNDQLVAIEASESSLMYAFKHNKLFAVTGYDPTYDLQYNVLSARHGAVNRLSVVKVSPYVYWLNPDLRVYRIMGGSIESVSDPVDETIMSMFGDYLTAQRKARLFKFNDRLLLTNDSSGTTLSYDYLNGTWQYFAGKSTNKYLTTFSYDTSQTTTGFGRYSDLLLLGNMKKFAIEQQTYRGVDSLNDTVTNVSFDYRSPYFGDGQSLWQIKAATFSPAGDSASYVLSIYNETGTVLAACTVYVPTSGFATYDVGFPTHVGKRVSLGIASSSPKSYGLRDIIIEPRKVANAPLR